jgi:hypothetical protein
VRNVLILDKIGICFYLNFAKKDVCKILVYYPEKSLVPNRCEMESKGTTLESSKLGELMTKANKVLKGKKREKKL